MKIRYVERSSIRKMIGIEAHTSEISSDNSSLITTNVVNCENSHSSVTISDFSLIFL